MNLPLSREMLAAAYDYLCTSPPFNKWNLPDSNEVVFKVARHPALRGWYQFGGSPKHTIAISSRCIGTTHSLMATMAHEMIHLLQEEVSMDTPGSEHNLAFWKLADRVCKFHGFDPKLF